MTVVCIGQVKALLSPREAYLIHDSKRRRLIRQGGLFQIINFQVQLIEINFPNFVYRKS